MTPEESEPEPRTTLPWCTTLHYPALVYYPDPTPPYTTLGTPCTPGYTSGKPGTPLGKPESGPKAGRSNVAKVSKSGKSEQK